MLYRGAIWASCRQCRHVFDYSLLYMVEGVGFEPTKPFRTPDLQSGGFNHSPTPPRCPTLAPGSRPMVPMRLAGWDSTVLREPQSGFEPLTCRLQVDCASIAPQGHRGRWVTGTPQMAPRLGPFRRNRITPNYCTKCLAQSQSALESNHTQIRQVLRSIFNGLTPPSCYSTLLANQYGPPAA